MPLRIGHRGAAGTHPENTMASFRQAVALGAQGIEFDVHLTADGQVAVIHDPFLDRSTNREGRVGDLTLAEIQQADAGAWKGEQFAGERVPSLVEFFHWAPPDLQLFLELKGGSSVYPGIEALLLELIDAHGVRERIQISSFDHDGLKRFRELDPTIQLGMLYNGYFDETLDPVNWAVEQKFNAIHPDHRLVTPELVARAHAAGLAVNVWTANEPADIARMKECGVDGIMSDYPDRLR